MLKKLLLNLFMLLVIVHLKDGSVLKYDANDVYTFEERVDIVKTVPTAIPNVFTGKIVAVFNIDEIRYVEVIQ